MVCGAPRRGGGGSVRAASPARRVGKQHRAHMRHKEHGVEREGRGWRKWGGMRERRERHDTKPSTFRARAHWEEEGGGKTRPSAPGQTAHGLGHAVRDRHTHVNHTGTCSHAHRPQREGGQGSGPAHRLHRLRQLLRHDRGGFGEVLGRKVKRAGCGEEGRWNTNGPSAAAERHAQDGERASSGT